MKHKRFLESESAAAIDPEHGIEILDRFFQGHQYPMPQKILDRVRESQQNTSWMESYNHPHALKLKYQHLHYNVEALPRNENIDTWEMFKDVKVRNGGNWSLLVAYHALVLRISLRVRTSPSMFVRTMFHSGCVALGHR